MSWITYLATCEGLELDRSTLGDWVGQAAWLLDPVVAAIRMHVFAAKKIHGDDTTVPVLAPGLGRTATGQLWVYVCDDRLFCGLGAPAAAYFYIGSPRSMRSRTRLGLPLLPSRSNIGERQHRC
jgi:transposase